MPTATEADAVSRCVIERNPERSLQLTNRIKRSRCAGPFQSATGRTEAFPVCLSNSSLWRKGAGLLVRLEVRLRIPVRSARRPGNGVRSGFRRLGTGAVSVPCRGPMEPGRHETCAAKGIRSDWNFPVSKPMACRAATLANVSASPASGHTSSCGVSCEFHTGPRPTRP